MDNKFIKSVRETVVLHQLNEDAENIVDRISQKLNLCLLNCTGFDDREKISTLIKFENILDKWLDEFGN